MMSLGNMTQSEKLQRELYGNRPHSDEDRERMIMFNRLEREMDEHNEQQFEIMDKDHLNKTKTKAIETAIRSWKKENDRQLKLLLDKKKLPNSAMSIERIWIKG